MGSSSARDRLNTVSMVGLPVPASSWDSVALPMVERRASSESERPRSALRPAQVRGEHVAHRTVLTVVRHHHPSTNSFDFPNTSRVWSFDVSIGHSGIRRTP